ncbi:hypothetical protein FQA39_LY11760 [Lamprigera yunnana]|nr:hypothetical protein FQA39_LY11760 [Lamprigera yunnana]
MDDFNYLIPSKNNAVNVVDGLPTTSMHVVEAVVPDHKKDVVRDYEKEETPLDGIYFIQFQDTPHHDLQQNALGTNSTPRKSQQDVYTPRRINEVVAELHAKFNKLIDMMTDAANVTASGKEDTSDYSNVDLRVDELNLFLINTEDKMDAVELNLLDKDFHGLYLPTYFSR